MADELAFPQSGKPSECPYKSIHFLRHITEEELVLRILGGSAQRFTEEDEEIEGFPRWWLPDEEVRKGASEGGGVYICTCGGDYQYHE